MTEKETTSGGAQWRKRAVATVGIAATVAAGGVALAASASAATPPVLTVTSPATIVNDNSPASDPLSIRVNNAGTGAGIPVNAGGQDVLSLTVVAPTGLSCLNITLMPENSGPTSQAVAPSPTLTLASGTFGTCVFNSTAGAANQPINSDTTYNYGVMINGSGTVGPPAVTGVTGAVTFQAVLKETIPPNANVVNVATSNTASSNLVSPTANTAAVFATTAPPAAIIYQPYSFTEATAVGTPDAADGSDYSAFVTNARPNDSGVYTTRTTRFADWDLYSSETDTTADAGISLNDLNNGDDGFYFDTATGKISWYDQDNAGDLIPGQPDETESLPDYSFNIIANNNTGGYIPAAGAPATIPGVGSGSQTQPTPDTNTHDVISPKFTLPVLFSDVSTTSTFGADIYGLSDQDAISGFVDGTFRPGVAVTRAQFVNILAKFDPFNRFNPGIVGSGECTTIEPSAFSDVPNSSIFCESIKSLSQAHVINGYADGKFHPNATINRQEIAAIAYRFYNVEETGSVLNGDAKFTSPSPFSDVTESNPFAGDIEWAAKNGVVKGYPNGTFKPANSTTRDATAAIIFRTGDLF